jgi:DNA-binding MarR family transcriptional regulator
MRQEKPKAPRVTVGFLLSQVGGRSAQEFGKLLASLDLAPPDAGILRALALSPGLSQQELAVKLGMHASRLVAMIDALEKRELVTRRPDANDRRVYRLQLSDAGREMLVAIGRAADAHEDVMCAGLSDRERAQLRTLLEKVVVRLGLAPGVHPGYRRLREGCGDEANRRANADSSPATARPKNAWGPVRPE